MLDHFQASIVATQRQFDVDLLEIDTNPVCL